jgi:transposase
VARCSRRSGARGSRGAWPESSRRCASGSPATSCAGCASSQAITRLEREITSLVGQLAPQLVSEPGFGPLTAAELVGEIAGAERFATAAKLARAAGAAPIPASSGNTHRHRLDQGGNRQINAALHRVIVTQARCHAQTRDYIARRRSEGKSTREAIRCLKRYLARHVWRLLQPPNPGKRKLPPSTP